jgi:hypothetical protein
MVAASALLSLMPPPGRGADGILSEDGARWGPATAAAMAPDASEAGPEFGPGLLDTAVTLELRTDRVTYLLGEEIHVTMIARARGLLDEALVLESRVGVADGSPSPDQGFGEGFRTVEFPGPLSLAREAGSVVESRLRLRATLEHWGIYHPGLYTLDARAALQRDDPAAGAVASNRVTIQVSENRLRQRYRQPSPVEPRPQANAPRAGGEPKKQSGRRAGGDRPGDEAGKRLPDVRTHDAAVKPLLSDGPHLEKEVEVFEREHGGDRPRPPAQRNGLPPEVNLDFARRREEVLRKLRLTPLETILVRNYFARLDGDRQDK